MRIARSPLVVSTLLLVCAPLSAQLPSARLDTVYPMGGARGESVDVEFTGDDLDGVDRLIFSHPGIVAEPQRGEKRPFEDEAPLVPNRFRVTIDGAVPEGIYELRAAGIYGVTNPRPFVVDSRPEITEPGPNESLEQAPRLALDTVVNARVDGGADRDFYEFELAKGQRVTIDCFAQRIDSALDAVLVVWTKNGAELDRSRVGYGLDPALDFSAPGDGGIFVLEVRDSTYRGGREMFYRLTISTAPHIAFVEPPAALAGGRQRFTLYGINLPGGEPVKDVLLEGKPLEALDVDILMPPEPAVRRFGFGALVEAPAGGLDSFEYRLSSERGASNPVRIGIATESVVLEREAKDDDAPQRVMAPCEIAGRFYPAQDRDWYEFDARKGEVFWIEVISHRLGLSTDPYLAVYEVKREKDGKESTHELTRQDDRDQNIGDAAFNTSTDDATHRFVAPSDSTFRVLVYDLQAGFTDDPRRQYRLAIRRERPDFRLVAAARARGPDPKKQDPTVSNPLLRAGEITPVEVMAFRHDGFDGEIDIEVRGLPEGVRSTATTIPRGAHNTTIYLETERASGWAGELDIVGTARIGDWTVERVARGSTVVATPRDNLGARAKVVSGCALAVADEETLPLVVSVESGGPWRMSRAGNLEIPVKLSRKTQFHGKLNIDAYELPSKVKMKTVSLDEKKPVDEAKLVIEIPRDAPLGTHSIYLLATAELDWVRGREELARAQARKAKVDAAVAELEAKVKVAKEDAAAAEESARLETELEELKAVQESVAKDEKAATDRTKPQKIKAGFLTCPLTIEIVAAPIRFSAGKPAAAIKLPRGKAHELVLGIERLFGCEDAVEIELKLPGSLKGAKAGALKLEGKAAEGTFALELAEDASAGRHEAALVAKLKYNKQDLSIERKVVLEVE